MKLFDWAQDHRLALDPLKFQYNYSKQLLF